MNIVESLAVYLATLGFGTIGTDIFIGSAPQGSPDKSTWLVSAGGSPVSRNKTGEVIKNYLINIFYRNTSEEDVYNTIHSLEVELNKSNCTQLANFDTIEIEAISFPTDQDLDNEDRTIGLIQAIVTTYYKE